MMMPTSSHEENNNNNEGVEIKMKQRMRVLSALCFLLLMILCLVVGSVVVNDAKQDVQPSIMNITWIVQNLPRQFIETLGDDQQRMKVEHGNQSSSRSSSHELKLQERQRKKARTQRSSQLYIRKIEEADGVNDDATDDIYDDNEEDDLVYIDDDFVDDDFYAFIDDPGPPSLFPLTSRDVSAFLISSMALTLGASGGLGGGGIVVPVYILVMGLQTKSAIPLGAVTVLGGSAASTYLNFYRRHPLADRPIIDWDLVLVMEPLTLIGTLLGTLLHRVLSEKYLIVLLVLLLSVSAQSTLAKAKRMYNAETKYIKHLKAARSEAAARTSPAGLQKFKKYWPGGVAAPHSDSIPCDSSEVPELKSPGSYRSLNPEEKQQILILNPDFITLRSGLMEEEKFTPRSKIIALCIMFSILVFLNMMVGGGAFQSPWGIRCGSVAFWVVQVIMVAFLGSSAWAAQTYLVNRHEIKEIVRFDYVHGDIKWDARSAIIYPALFVCSGLSAGLFGIGGGMITVPLMLALGVHPAVVSSTSSAMILFTSVASTTSFYVFGLILKDYAVVCLLIGFFASWFGQKIMRQARQAKSASGENFERNSYIAFCIGGVILVSALLMTIEYVFKVVQYEDASDEGGLCEGYRM